MADRWCAAWVLGALALSLMTSAGAQLDDAQKAFQQGYAYQTGETTGKPDLDLALRFYAQALRLNPQFYEAHANAGQIYYQQRRYQRAKYHFNEAVKLARARDDIGVVDEARVASDLGGCFFQEGDLRDAERWLRGALALDASLVEAHYNLINLLLRQERFDEARQQLVQAQQQAPSERYGIFVGRLQTKESYAAWNPMWLKVVIGLGAIAVIAFVVVRGIGAMRSK